MIIKDLDIDLDDLAAIQCFRRKYPTWWYKIGVCDVSWDFDCAPQVCSPEIIHIINGDWKDECFSYDSSMSLHDAIGRVMKEIEDKLKDATMNNTKKKTIDASAAVASRRIGENPRKG